MPRPTHPYVPSAAGFLYLAIVLDAFSRRVVGWSMAKHLRSELVLAALDMAFEQRRPEAVIHHSDQGRQYTSIAFGTRCGEMGVRSYALLTSAPDFTGCPLRCRSLRSRPSKAARSLHLGQPREAVLCAWGIDATGAKHPLGLLPGTKEDTASAREFLRDLKAWGLPDPILVASDGAAGLIRALEEVFPRSLRQRPAGARRLPDSEPHACAPRSRGVSQAVGA